MSDPITGLQKHPIIEPTSSGLYPTVDVGGATLRLTTGAIQMAGAGAIALSSTGGIALTGGGAIAVTAQTVQAFKYECSLTASQGAWVHGVKVEVTRAANIQPATGCWFGAQFVLNAGSAGYDALNKDAYVLQCIFKGSDTTPNGEDIHVGRFEIQSAGSVSDIVHILANSGCAVAGHLLYIASHINADGALINVQSSATMAKGLSFMAGAGATLTSLLYASGAGTFTNFLEVAATGDGGVTTGTSMHKNPTSDEEAGFLTIKVGTVSYQIPFWASS